MALPAASESDQADLQQLAHQIGQLSIKQETLPTIAEGTMLPNPPGTASASGLVYDERCSLHKGGALHKEKPERISKIFSKLKSSVRYSVYL
jgi:hypothetical protein